MKKLLLTFGLLSLGCNPHDLKSVELNTNLVPQHSFVMDVDKRVDILFVIDNSGSMAEEQVKLATNFGPMVQGLEDAGVSYRIGLTTTDMGGIGPTCLNTGGVLRARSCFGNESDFIVQNPFLNMYEEACLCNKTTEDIGLQNPWIEPNNFNPELQVEEVFQCMAPQGISGCGFESPLESMYETLVEGTLDGHQEFLRDGALLSVIILTDEEDCSWREDVIFGEPFSNGGFLSSANCWRAGVSCNDMGLCVPMDYDEFGDPTIPDNAVLYPLSRYFLDLPNHSSVEREVLLSIISGVPEGYPETPILYTWDNNESVSLFGVDPGCVKGDQTAIPPVRLKGVADAMGGSLYSVCQDSYQQTITDITETLLQEIAPACFKSCVLDTDPSTPDLDYSCEMVQSSGSIQESIPECTNAPQVPEGEIACWEVKVGEERDAICQEEPNQNLEFLLHRQSGIDVPLHAKISVSCEASIHPELDCG